MALIADTSGLLAAMDADDPANERVRRIIESEPGSIYVPDLVLAEVDYLVLQRLGRKAEEVFLADVAEGAWSREPLTDADLAQARKLIEKYREHDIGLTDATIVAAAGRLGINRILTLDLRHFRLFRTQKGRPFRLLPADAPDS
jgi:predicted nucleic acid-binding protein